MLYDWTTTNRRSLGVVCDPFAGDGRLLIHDGSFGVEIDGRLVPLTKDRTVRVYVGDAFAWFDTSKRFDHVDTIVTNPPYSRMEEALHTFVPLVGLSCWLLRLNVLGGQKRSVWMRENMPAHVLVLPKRPSFTNGGTDATEYAWFVWRGAGRTRPAELEILPLPTKE